MAGYVYMLQRADGKLVTGVSVERRWNGKAEMKGRIVYFEELDQLEDAMAVEKMIKGLTRRKKLALIKKMNLKFEDLNYSEIENARLANQNK